MEGFAATVARGEHFGVIDAFSGGHPLGPSGFDGVVVAHRVAMVDFALDDPGESFDAAVGVFGESLGLVVWAFHHKVVAEHEGVEHD